MDVSSAVLKKLAVHIVGNKGLGQELVLAKRPAELSEQEKRVVGKAFVSAFNMEGERYRFHHLSSLEYNEVYNYCLEALAEPKVFHKQGVNIARHLYEASVHPKIKNGELYIAHLENCIADGGAYVDAIAIFKTEAKSSFFELGGGDGDIAVAVKEGVDITKFDKAALVLASNAENGFDVLLFDNNRGEEAVFWRETFLGVAPQANEYYQTKEFLGMAKQFIVKQIPQEYEIEKAEQIELLNKSVEYFRANSSFSRKDFEKEVFEDSGYIKAFRQFGESYQEHNDLELPERFDISTQAVKRQARVFKSVLKLDKNFHVYIHGNRDLIEKGYDEAVGKHYYKIYFDEES